MENELLDNASIILMDRLNQHPNLYRYLLLDPLKKVSCVNPLHLDNIQQALGKDAIYPVLRRDLAYLPEYCPQLVLLASPGERCEYQGLDEAENYARSEALHEKRYFCACLASTQGPALLAKFLAEQCNHFVESSFLAFFEPLRFELLHAMSPKESLAASLAPISHWWYMTAAGELACQAGHDAEEKCRLNWLAEETQQHMPEIRQLLLAWQQVNSTLPSDAALQAAKAWGHTIKTGLIEKGDRYFLALNRLTLGVDIEAHPVSRNLLLQEVANPSQRFTKILQALPDVIWQELKGQAQHKWNGVGVTPYGS